MFEKVRQLEPHYMDGMEIYSTTLWHLQRDILLSRLAQELTAFDKLSPQVHHAFTLRTFLAYYYTLCLFTYSCFIKRVLIFDILLFL